MKDNPNLLPSEVIMTSKMLVGIIGIVGFLWLAVAVLYIKIWKLQRSYKHFRMVLAETGQVVEKQEKILESRGIIKSTFSQVFSVFKWAGLVVRMATLGF